MHYKGAGLGRPAKLAQKTTTQKRQKRAEPLAQTKMTFYAVKFEKAATLRRKSPLETQI